ncbi:MULTISPECIES: iron ABC transporter permease [Pseudanabaena]|jgi:iron complex transport system permease protein|uniref:iron ABC transporter permease n=1 Tax=Pseudanabaena TaxID=1152 RepID=UPI00247AEA02|nr:MULTISPECIES: iron ABC transporter permease [Pseudanabaena]MEA5485253.1 iron ABC transporter permease [Pseudanabaena sp. CCNP1317]WGS72616.1 iron ABC transporter permease [Pseudanabaena galeata CCNP1313]
MDYPLKYSLKEHRIALIFLALLISLGLSAIASLVVGSVWIPLPDLVKIILHQSPETGWAQIFWQFRLPKALTAIFCGAALAVSGLQMQVLFGNPLAGPFVLGVSSGASLGVAIAILATEALGQVSAVLGSESTLVAACIGAAFSMGLVAIASKFVQNSTTLLVLGLMMGYGVGAVVNILLYFSSPERVQSYINWTFGSFAGVTVARLPMLCGAISLGLLLAIAAIKPLNTMLLGEMQARSLGTQISKLRLGIVINVALLAGTVTAFCGPIAFLGVAVPHLCRALFRSTDCRIILPATILVGANLAIAADLVTQLPNKTLLPLNSVTSLLGAPIVVWTILRRK